MASAIQEAIAKKLKEKAAQTGGEAPRIETVNTQSLKKNSDSGRRVG